VVIKVQVREVCGKAVAYPANREAEILATIAGTKTLTYETLAKASDLGLVIETVTSQKAWFDQLV
jgi:hypothetical protein